MPSYKPVGVDEDSLFPPRVEERLSRVYVPRQLTAPNPAVATGWLDSSTSPPTLKGWNGSAWVPIGGGIAHIGGLSPKPSGNLYLYGADNSGVDTGNANLVRTTTDGITSGWMNVSSQSAAGYIGHFTAADGMVGDGLIGIGISSTAGAMTGLVTSQKGSGIGYGANNTATANTGYAIQGGNLGGTWLRAIMGGAGYSSKSLIELQGWTGATNGARSLSCQDQSLNEYLYIDPVSRQLWITQGSGTPANNHQTTWTLGNGVIQKMYVYSGSAGLFYGSQVRAQSNLLKLDVAQNAAIGAHTYQTAFTAQATGSGFPSIALYGGSPVVQPVRVGQLTDSSGGASGGATIAAIVASAGDATGADLTTTKNAIATLAAKINAMEAKLSAAGGGIGVWA